MAFRGKATSSGGGSGEGFPKAPPGNHPAVLVAMIDLGTQRERKYGSEDYRDVRKVYLCWELVEEVIPGTKDNFLIGRDYALSYHEKAALRLMLEGWRNKTYQDGDDIDYGKALGGKCLLSVKNKKSKGGDAEYPRIEGVSSPPKGTAVKSPQRTPTMWEFGANTLDELPDWLPYHYGQSVADIIKESREYKEGSGANGEAHGGDSEIPEGEEVIF